MSTDAHSGVITAITVNGINIGPLVDKIDITENIGSERGGGHVVASVRISDGTGFEDKFKSGDDIEFNVGSATLGSLKFKLCIAEKDSEVQHKPELKAYDIRCISKTSLASHSKTAEKGYKKQSPTEIASDMWKPLEEIEGTKLDIRSNAEGKIDWATPRGSPPNAINTILREGGQEGKANNFRFFETLNNSNRTYVIETEEDMKKKGSVANYKIEYPTDKGISNPGNQQNTVVAHTFDTGFSVPGQITSGGGSSKSDYTDVATMQFGERSNEYGLDEYTKYGHTGNQIPFGDNIVSLLGNKENNTVEQHIITNRYSNEKSKFYKARRGENEHDRVKQDNSSTDQANRGQTPTMKAVFVVPGNPALGAGKTINVDIKGTGEQAGKDQTKTGKYLISKLTHSIFKDGNQMKYYCKIEANKDAIG